MKCTLINSIKAGILVGVVLLALTGCGSGGESPEYLGADEGNGPSPSVDEKLAGEAWQQRLVYHIGPVDLPAHTEAAAMIDKPLALRFQTDEAIWVTGMVPRVVDTNGGELPAELLHSAIISNMHEDNAFCSSGSGGNPFFIASSMLTEVSFPQGFAYPVLATDPLEAQVVLANPTDTSFAGVSLELTLVARPMNEFADLQDIKPMLIETDPCTHAPLTVEPGEVAQRSASYPVAVPGDIVVVQGVLQSYGATIALTAGEEGEPFWSSEAMLDEDHNLIELTDNPLVDAGVAVSSGDVLKMDVTYDNASEIWLKGATAAAMVYLAPSE